jgi:hypothetical protein
MAANSAGLPGKVRARYDPRCQPFIHTQAENARPGVVGNNVEVVDAAGNLRHRFVFCGCPDGSARKTTRPSSSTAAKAPPATRSFFRFGASSDLARTAGRRAACATVADDGESILPPPRSLKTFGPFSRDLENLGQWFPGPRLSNRYCFASPAVPGLL